MDLQDDLRGIFEKMEGDASKWLLVVVGVIVLLRLKLVLFACALPVLAYWHFSNGWNDDSGGGGAADAGEADDGAMDGAEPWPQGADDEDDDMGFRPAATARGKVDLDDTGKVDLD